MNTYIIKDRRSAENVFLSTCICALTQIKCCIVQVYINVCIAILGLFISFDHILLLDIKQEEEIYHHSAIQLQNIDIINIITNDMPKVSILYEKICLKI